ncbi:hypothetical protein QE392_002931 [Microbacterium proteolyticum]|nr:hypothetical protein [Microbacterium sp. SORGH_AS_0344]MDQ1171127.1 hypothetical protein [Microbacterium proteolyticum]
MMLVLAVDAVAVRMGVARVRLVPCGGCRGCAERGLA